MEFAITEQVYWYKMIHFDLADIYSIIIHFVI